MNDNTSQRKEWVKNVAIIFLVVLLLLTFFSNTIMNYSLPEVATSYVQTGSITAKVRGTGNVEATDPFNVIVSESRVITSVAVKQGDEVEKDAVLYYLEDKESAELKTAEAELNTMILAYMLQLFNGTTSADIINKVESGRTDSFSAYKAKIAEIQGRIKVAENNVTANENNVNNLTKQSNLISNNATIDTTEENNAVNSAQNNLENAKNSVTNIETKIANLLTKKSQLESDIAAAVALVPGIASGGTTTGGIKELQDKESAAKTELGAQIGKVTSAVNTVLTTTLGDEAAMAEVKSKTLLQVKYPSGGVEYDAGVVAYDNAYNAYSIAKAAYDVAKAELDKATTILTNYQSYVNQLAKTENDIASAQKELSSATGNVSSANSALNTANQVLQNKENNQDNAQAQTSIKAQLIEAEANLARAQTALELVEAEQVTLLANIQAELNLGNENTLISDKRAEIEELKKKSIGAAILSPVKGTVTSIAHVAGESTKPEEVVAVVQAAGKGFTLSFSVTNEQAQKVQIGDTAELQNSWYYNDVQVILASIKPDPDSPGQKKLLTFNITGESIQAGQALNISVGQRNAEYELVVPNSAMREDSNGKFILIVEPKNSPLGNRYFATRVDVEVLASDDTNTALSGGLYGYEYAITTATKPVEAGKQVRLNN